MLTVWAGCRLWDPETGGLLAALALSSPPAAPKGAGAQAAGRCDRAAGEDGCGGPHAIEAEADEQAGMPDACAPGDTAAADEAAEAGPGGGPGSDAGGTQAAAGGPDTGTGATCGAAASQGLGGARSVAEVAADDADGALEEDVAEEPGDDAPGARPRHFAIAQLPPAVLAVAVTPDGCACLPRAPGFAAARASVRRPCELPPQSGCRTGALHGDCCLCAMGVPCKKLPHCIAGALQRPSRGLTEQQPRRCTAAAAVEGLRELLLLAVDGAAGSLAVTQELALPGLAAPTAVAFDRGGRLWVAGGVVGEGVCCATLKLRVAVRGSHGVRCHPEGLHACGPEDSGYLPALLRRAAAASTFRMLHIKDQLLGPLQLFLDAMMPS